MNVIAILLPYIIMLLHKASLLFMIVVTLRWWQKTYTVHITPFHFEVTCGEPAISLHSHHVSLVQWTTHLLPVTGTRVQNPWGDLCETGILRLALSRYIGDPDVIDDFCGLVWGGLRPEPSLGPCGNNVIIPLDLTQLFCPGFTLAADPPSSFTTNRVGCWGGALWRDFILTMSHWSSGLQVCVLWQGTRVQNPWGDLCETGFLLLALSRYKRANICWSHNVVQNTMKFLQTTSFMHYLCFVKRKERK